MSNDRNFETERFGGFCFDKAVQAWLNKHIVSWEAVGQESALGFSRVPAHLLGGAASDGSRSRTVPEDKCNLSPEEQVTQLQAWLVERAPDFAKVRGRCGSATSFLQALVRTAASPAAAERAFETWAQRMRPFVRRLALLNREDHTSAFNELGQALGDPAFVFTGEDVPMSQTVPVTVVMPAPEATLALLRCMHSGLLWKLRYTLSRQHTLRGAPLFWQEGLSEDEIGLINSLLRALPDVVLEKDVPLADPLLQAHATKTTQVWQQLDSVEWPFRWWLRPYALLQQEGSGVAKHKRTPPVDHHIDPRTTPGFVAMLIQAEQREVIKILGEDANVATWQLRLPRPAWEKIARAGDESKAIVLFEEALFHEHSRKHPAFTSKSVSNGLGVVFGRERSGLKDPRLIDGHSVTLDPFVCLLF